jgi:hypothetical protein
MVASATVLRRHRIGDAIAAFGNKIPAKMAFAARLDIAAMQQMIDCAVTSALF